MVNTRNFSWEALLKSHDDDMDKPTVAYRFGDREFGNERLFLNPKPDHGFELRDDNGFLFKDDDGFSFEG